MNVKWNATRTALGKNSRFSKKQFACFVNSIKSFLAMLIVIVDFCCRKWFLVPGVCDSGEKRTR